MGELKVTATHNSTISRIIQSTLHVSFPIWGIIAPMAFVFMVFTIVSSWWFRAPMAIGASSQYMIQFVGVMLSLFFVPLGCLMVAKILKHNYLSMDKNGILLPLDFAQFWRLKKYYHWADIGKIAVTSVNSKSTKVEDKNLVLYTRSGKVLTLGLNHYKPSEIEQMLVSFDMWASGAERDLSVDSLHTALRSSSATKHGGSYTDMWEEELRRRFSPAAFMPLEPGRVLRNGSLKVVRQLAVGGLSAIYLCQLENQKLVVLKEAVVPEDCAESVREKARELFNREAELLSKLSHPSIVQVFDFFVDSGRSYMMLDYVAGQDLRQYVRQNGVPSENTVIDWAIQIVTIMKYLHEQDPPIIHRDLTPDNLVLREDGVIVLIDFGAANEFISKATGTFVGKQSYIAPEQFRGKAVVQSDIYALGCTLHYLLTGAEPEALSTSIPKDVNTAVSPELNEVVVSCTQMDAADRFQSAAQLLPVLRRIAAAAFGVA
jgi:tRNA A-37 threonylcarbamoyl transferase component Bud32